ncbi:Cdc25 family phosphatase Ibp1 [Schizosaccharomyces cryophilus OY26]|uniref:Cdc25 family phosphatase Ibp1 n=1 Tax=Schizosaccharomyces cryophilus (strain OY26 / ATCC MYA-4695 / CBS 11777 / NBRC 106824 / NRRL Y48691) TaxID=653667 RepID=S9X0Q8_SCHCR|nr:Cdc25 family phosphatase Ibp1 [Schizosaccharomyces cryophilus OY26]EPY50557.1 Cdc25 family phosphatase Ibp1 [Schizosaccharomyces cryophilus OY26]
MSSLNYISPESLKDLLAGDREKISVIDVRDDDYEGGHIPGSINIPSKQFLTLVDEYVEQLLQQKDIVLHCTYSQIRGPKAARILYETLRYRAQNLCSAKNLPVDEKEQFFLRLPSIYILHGGFLAWKSRYGEIPNMIE